MDHSKLQTEVVSNDAKPSNSSTEVRQAFINSQIGASALDLDKHLAWMGGYVLDQLIIRATDVGYEVIVKAHRGRTPYVAFVASQSLVGSIELVGEFASRGCLVWQKDKWPSKRLRRLLGRI